MKTYFIRHSEKLDISEKTLSDLIEKNLIAIHYPFRTINKETDDCTSINPSDYEEQKARSALRTLHKLSEEGGYVCAEYRNKEGAVVGIVTPNTPIELFEGKWGTQKDKIAILKTLHLATSRHLDAEEYLKISYARPIQGTICIWKNAGKRIEHMANHTCFEPIFDNLAPTHQEVLCSEFLRSGIDPRLPKIQSFLLPVGRTLKDIDIFGITESGQKVYCQVTHKQLQHAAEKMKNLKIYRSANSYVVMFCMNNQAHILSSEGVIIYSMHTVFEKFSNTKEGKMWLTTVFE